MSTMTGLTRSALTVAVVASTGFSTPALADGEPNVKVGGLMFAHWGYDMTPTPYEGYVDGDPRPNEFELDRAYLDFRSKLDETFSVRVTTDVGRQDGKKLGFFVKYAYLQVALAEDVKLRFGSAGTPMVGFSDKFWGQRWLAKSFTDQEKILSSADLGVHAVGKHADGLVSWGASLINGEGYGSIDTDFDKAIQARVTIDPLHGEMKLPISVFVSKDFYTHDDVDGHTVLVGSVGFDQEYASVWGEYVTDTAGDLKGSGMSANVVGKVPDLFNVVVRYDQWDPNEDVEDDAHSMIRGGITKDFMKKISAGFMYEQTKYEADPDQPNKGFFVRMQAGF